MKWSELSTEERDRLVHEKVMGRPAGTCEGTAYYTGRIGIDEWYCEECKKYFYDVEADGLYKHDAPIPSYNIDMNAAWKIVEKMTARMGYENPGFKWLGPIFKPEDEYISSSQHSEHNITHHFDYTRNGGFHLGCPCWYVRILNDGAYEWIMADTPIDAILLAALKACGIEIEP